MLVYNKERYHWHIRTITTVIICLFLYSNIAFALSPQLRVNQKQFSEEYIAGYTKLAHAAINSNIRSKLPPGGIQELRSTRPQDVDDTEEITVGKSSRKIIILAIPDLAKDTGQLAHIGLGRQLGAPVIYIDKRYFNNSALRNHEKNKIAKWETRRLELGKTYSGMREWILDPATHDEARAFADKVDKEVKPGVRELYNNVKNFADLGSIYALYSEYGLDRDDEDINIAASSAKLFEDLLKKDIAGRKKQVGKSWIEENTPDLKGKTIVSISMEGNIPEFEGYDAQNANTKGGLGAYFGDKLEGLAKIGALAYGIQPGYSHILKYGRKVKVDYDALIEAGIMKEVLVGDDALIVRAWDEDPEARSGAEEDGNNPKVRLEVYAINRGGTIDFIVRSKVLDILYPDDRAHRFTQEIVFGKAVYELLKKLDIKPDILHLNEAHTVVAAAQMKADESFDDTAILYTNHTLVPAGLETFSSGSLKSDVDRMMYVIGLPGSKAAKFRSVFLRPDGTVDFCYAAMKLADVINAVSDEHAKATAKIFKNLYGDEFDKPVTGVLNGSGETWKSDELKEFENENGAPDEEGLWKIHEHGRQEAFAEIEKRIGVKLDPDKPTLWAVRRLVDYKSQYPMLRFLVHILTADKDRSFTRDELKTLWFRDIPDLAKEYNGGIVESNLDKIFNYGQRERVCGLGMQIVVGGPEYMPFWVYEFMRWAYDVPEFKGRFVYAHSPDAKLLKMQAIGSDICVTMPRPLEEACGTSDQRTGLNGGVNIAIKGAGPAEWMVDYDEETGEGSGLFIGSYTKETQGELEADNDKFYREAPADIFAKCEICARLFYEEGKGKWKHLMRNSYLAANERVTAEAMEKRYAKSVYLPAISKKLNAELEKEFGEAFQKFAVTCMKQLQLMRQYNETGDMDSIRKCAEKIRASLRKELSSPSISMIRNIAQDSMQICAAMSLIKYDKLIISKFIDEAEAAIAELEKLRVAERLLEAENARIRSALLDATLVLGGKEEKKGEGPLPAKPEPPDMAKEKERVYKRTSPAEFLRTIKDNNILMKNAINKTAGVKIEDVVNARGGYLYHKSISSAFRLLRALDILVPVEGRRLYYRFSDKFLGPDEDYTGTLINAAINVRYQLGKRGDDRPLCRSGISAAKIRPIRALIDMAIIHQINIEQRPAVTNNRILWHIIEEGVIPLRQRSTIVTRINKAFRDTDLPERILILEDGRSVKDAIEEIRSKDQSAIVDIALSSEEHISDVPDDKEIKMLVFKNAKGYIQLEGVVAALRALHSQDALPMLLRLYSIMAGQPFNDPPDSLSDDPKKFALKLIFDLPKAAKVPSNDIPKLNDRILELLTAA